jgi:hypothetical protein
MSVARNWYREVRVCVAFSWWKSNSIWVGLGLRCNNFVGYAVGLLAHSLFLLSLVRPCKLVCQSSCRICIRRH